jgi:HAD superfamily hydrolase (TIGR01509 family)
VCTDTPSFISTKEIKPMTRIKAILFDHDGTLVNSEGIHHGIWQQLLAGYGLELSDAEYKAHFVGVPSKESAAALVQRRNLAVNPSQLLKQKEALTKSYLDLQAFPLMPGALEAVAAVQLLGLKLGIVTGAGPDGLFATLRDYGWSQCFEVVVSGEDVQRSKPAPDVYLLALSKLGIQAHEAIALEDTATGVQSATNAGLVCIAVPHEHSANQDFSMATHVMPSMSHATAWLSANCEQ